MIVLKGKVERLQGWRAFIKITSLDEKDIAPLCFELPLDRFAISAGDDIELRIGKCNVDVTNSEEVPEQ